MAQETKRSEKRPVLIHKNITVTFDIKSREDLPKLRTFMKVNNLKINKSEVARQLNMDRRTVAKYLDGYKRPTGRKKHSRVEEYKPIIEELLNSETQIFYYRKVLWQYLKDNHGMDIPLPTFYHYLKNTPEFDEYFTSGRIPKRSSNPVVRFETLPGQQAQIDWKESVPFVLKDTGEIIRINVFTMILGHSRFRIFKPSLFMTQDVVMHLMVEMFEAIGGVPKEIITDNMKTVMDRPRTLKSVGEINKKFQAFADDFGFKVKPCVVKTPQTKGKVESTMKLLDEIRAYSGKLNLVELYDKITEINDRVNYNISRGTGRIPIRDLKKEKDSLLPLPHESIRNQYRLKSQRAKVDRSSCVSIQSNQYSVPTAYIGKTVEYQIHDFNAYVYYSTKLIAVHMLSDQKLNYHPEHYEEILSSAFPAKNAEEISDMARINLSAIGGIYGD